MKRILFPLLMVAFCVAVVFLCVEVYVRVVVDDGMQFDLEMWKYAKAVKIVDPDPLIGHRHGANRKAKLMGVTVETNSQGLRDREYTFEKPPGVLRIVMLGDSFTEGWGTAEPDTFSKRIERLYSDQGTKAEVINTGVGNWNTIQEVEFFMTDAYRYNPDIIVLNFTFNDAEPVPHDRPPSFLLRYCYSCVFLVGRYDALKRMIFGGQDWLDYYLGLFGDGTAPGWLGAKAAIKRLADYCREHNIKLLIANHPELHDVKNYPLQRITGFVQSAAAENNVAFVDLLPYLRDQNSASLWVTPPDPHPNAFAHKLLADGIFEALQKLQTAQ
ncbi:MAG TPA: SGNH/GDSL hydrolase family protein [Stellaceae bacterium]|nr:SGNH/GDSL hydrolase family protein [Stellaceae bacterium]